MHGICAALQCCMKRSPIRLPKIDVHSIAFQTKAELVAGAIFTALLMRWVM